MAEIEAPVAVEAAPRELGPRESSFSFLKGAEDIVAPKDGKAFEWEQAAAKVREHLNDAMNARNVAFLLGSGCSSHQIENRQVGVPTMKPMAQKFIGTVGSAGDRYFATETERNTLQSALGLNVRSYEQKLVTA
jgi:hypothetical protein